MVEHTKKKYLQFLFEIPFDPFLPQDRTHFAELVEKELSSLHEGNIARYQIRPSYYPKWKKPDEQRF